MNDVLFPRLSADDVRPSRGGDLLDDITLETTQRIIDDVRDRGEAALRRYAEEFDGLKPNEPHSLSRADLEAALGRIDARDRGVLERTCARITAFAAAQRGSISPLSVEIPGGRAGHTLEPIERVGCYAPGGRYPLPSSVLMAVATARAAGCPNVCVATPSRDDIMLAAAAIAGADEVLLTGGAQAVAALAFGVAVAAPVDIIVGPGNRWVTAAKHLVSRHTAIDMLAGPSELVVLADSSGDARLIAGDLLAQAEHDVDARPFLVTTSEPLADEVEAALAAQLVTLPTRETAEAALKNGGAIVVKNLAEAVAVCDTLAPEHLEICAVDARGLAKRVRHAGAIFLGEHAAEVFGDYGLGPNHSLPTNGAARSTAGLSVFTFLRMRTWMELEEPLDDEATADVLRLAELEKLEAHRRAAASHARAARTADSGAEA